MLSPAVRECKRNTPATWCTSRSTTGESPRSGKPAATPPELHRRYSGDPRVNLAMQGCRKYDLSSDECGPFSDFKYVPPPSVQTVKCNPPENFQAAEVPAGQQCVPKPKVTVPRRFADDRGSSLDKCAPAPPKACPPGSALRRCRPARSARDRRMPSRCSVTQRWVQRERGDHQ